MKRIILKYGGSSLATPACVGRAARQIAEQAKQAQVVAVLSAQGKTTDALLKEAGDYGSDGGAAFLREADQLLACGEQMSAALCAMALQRMGVPAISLNGWQMGLLAEGPQGDAIPVALTSDRIQRELEKGRVVLATGFQAVNRAGDLITLGRGGSDTTAVALCWLLQAERCVICTDVDGVYTADPRQDPGARKLARVDYGRMLAMARSGAKVLHDRSVELAMEHGVEIEVRSSFSDEPGTIVHL